MGSQILAFSVFKAKQVEAPVIGKVPPAGIQEVAKAASNLYIGYRFRRYYLVGEREMHQRRKS
jgi:hypothetical protein